jgi:hypothetical protein
MPPIQNSVAGREPASQPELCAGRIEAGSRGVEKPSVIYLLPPLP